MLSNQVGCRHCNCAGTLSSCEKLTYACKLATGIVETMELIEESGVEPCITMWCRKCLKVSMIPPIYGEIGQCACVHFSSLCAKWSNKKKQ